MRRVQFILAGVLILVLAAAGCLEFDEQTIYFEYDRHRDRLVMVVNYGGLYAAADNGRPDMDNSQKQLEDAIQAQRVAFFGNFPLLWSSEEVRKEVTGPNQEKDEPQAVRDKVVRLTELVQVLNAGFYTDGAGRVCGAQVVVIEHASEALDLINGIINLDLVAEAADEKGRDHGEFGNLVAEYARKGHRWVALDGNSLIVSIPMSEQVLKKGWPEVTRGLDSFLGKEPGTFAARLRQFLSTPVFVWHDDKMLKIKWGLPSYPSVLPTRPAEGKYQPNMVEYITQEHGLDLDARLARYLLDPEAIPESEAERAAKLMAPRLTQAERVRVLVHQLRAAPSEPFWAMLHKEPPAEGRKPAPAAATNEELLKQWEAWLKAQTPTPKADAAKADVAKPALDQK